MALSGFRGGSTEQQEEERGARGTSPSDEGTYQPQPLLGALGVCQTPLCRYHSEVAAQYLKLSGP